MRCEKGDIAVIVRSCCKENIGLLVDVVAATPLGTFKHNGLLYDISTPAWIVVSKGSKMCLTSMTNKLMGLVSERVYDDYCLMPLREKPNVYEDDVYEVRELVTIDTRKPIKK